MKSHELFTLLCDKFREHATRKDNVGYIGINLEVFENKLSEYGQACRREAIEQYKNELSKVGDVTIFQNQYISEKSQLLFTADEQPKTTYTLGEIAEEVKNIALKDINSIDKQNREKACITYGRLYSYVECLDWTNDERINDHLPKIMKELLKDLGDCFGLNKGAK